MGELDLGCGGLVVKQQRVFHTAQCSPPVALFGACIDRNDLLCLAAAGAGLEISKLPIEQATGIARYVIALWRTTFVRIYIYFAMRGFDVFQISSRCVVVR